MTIKRINNQIYLQSSISHSVPYVNNFFRTKFYQGIIQIIYPMINSGKELIKQRKSYIGLICTSIGNIITRRRLRVTGKTMHKE